MKNPTLLTTLQNKYNAKKQELEYGLECELNVGHPNLATIDIFLEKIAIITIKQNVWDGYVDAILNPHSNGNTNGDTE